MQDRVILQLSNIGYASEVIFIILASESLIDSKEKIIVELKTYHPQVILSMTNVFLTSVTRSGDFLDFGQLFKVFGSN